MKKLIAILLLVIVSSCSGEDFRNERDFRNYLRDKHPYSVLKKVELNDAKYSYNIYTYVLYDTIKHDIFLYSLYMDSGNKILKDFKIK